MKRLVAAVLFLAALAVAAHAQPSSKKIYVILWFDTEDYILPADDDATLHLSEWLKKEGIRATFKLVGEKARTLERRKRTDVIESLKQHEIGYHSNFHSVQPSPAMYLSNLGWDEGVAEFDRREGQGVADLKRMFGVTPSCYGQPGSSWGPQSFGAMAKWGMKVYLDAGSHVNVDGKPHYYCGLLTLYRLTHTLRTDLGGEADLKKAEDRFLQSRKQLLDEGGGVVSIFYHPCEFVHKKFWDGVNFSKGANPPREEWQLPPTKTEAESQTAYETFEKYIRFIKRFPEVQFITANEAAEIYRDKARGRRFIANDIMEIARNVASDVDLQKRDDVVLAPSEILLLLNSYFVALTKGDRTTDVILDSTPLGMTGSPAVMSENVTTTLNQFTRTARDVADYMSKHDRVPSAVWLGSAAVTPEAYLVALARVIVDMEKLANEPVAVKPASLATTKYVAADDPKLWGWVIFPPGFRAPAMMDLAKRQAWTIKPAVNHGAAAR